MAVETSFAANVDLLLDVMPMLIYATACGAVVGFERGRRGAAAGMKTQVFICVGSALFTAAAHAINKDANGETGRMIAQIASGVGFIGAGAIMAKDRIIGLTTAAIIWVMAGLGILCGIGFGPAAIALSLGMVVMINLLSFIEKRYIPTHSHQEIALHETSEEPIKISKAS